VLVLIDVRYPSSSMKRAIEVFMSPEMPKRADSVREVGSFTYTAHDGIRSLFILDVDDKHLAEYVVAQSERTVHMQSRIPGFNVEVQIGQSVQDAIATALKQLPK
jgi:hypothetical protein